jgi:hypothetical protein
MRIQSQHTRQVRLVAAMFLMGTLFFSCDQLAGPGSAEQGGTNNNEGGTNNNEGQLNGYSVSADGVNNETDSTALSFIFDKAVSDLGAEHIYIVNGTGSVTPGTLSGEGAVRSLEIGVVTAGNITVRIAKEGVDDAEKTLTVYKQGQMAVLSWTVSANGSADREDTVALTFTFSGAVPALSGDDIRIEQGTGKASAVDLTGNGQNWLLLIAVEQAGTINISINRDGIDPEYQRITVHKGYEAPPPERVGITVLSPPTTTYYGRGQTFDTTGLVVAWFYSDGSTEEIPAGGYTVVRPNMTVYSPKAVVVRAGGFETSFNINVVNTDKILQTISVSGSYKKVQDFGKEFDRTGLVVTGNFSNGSSEDITSLAVIMGYDKFKRGSQTVAVNVNGVTAQIEDISTRIGEAAYITVFTGYGVKTAFIKGETMTAEKANIGFKINSNGDQYPLRDLSLKTGGLVPEDFSSLIAAYNPNQIGKQTLSMTLDGRPFEIDFYVVDAEPAVWFDFGYMRHAGDPTGAGKGAGIDNGKYYARANETLIIVPVRYLVGYNDDNSDVGASYNWTVSGNDSDRTYSTSKGGEFLHITPTTAGTYTISVSVTGRNYITGSSITKTAQADVVCYTGTVSANGKTFVSPLKNFGAGQMCEGGTGLGWSLGSAGGYEVWKVNPQASYKIYGNAFGGWNEPGIVWVQEDNNGNGLPDEMWYELTGGDETDHARKNQITRRYAVTYFKTDGKSVTNEYGQLIRGVYWADSKGRTGMIPGGFPDKYWGVEGGWVTYTCTLLRDDGNIFFSSYNLTGLTGYVDTVDDCKFHVSDAIYADGTPAKNLPAVNFIKVQTGIFRYGDIFGDVSTEISYGDGLPEQHGDFPMP